MIDMSKKYTTRDGRQVKILCIDREHNKSVVGLIFDNGKYYSNGCESHMDLIEVSPYEDFKIDDPVMVRSGESDKWSFRHFAGCVEGNPYAWDDGKTSFTVGYEVAKTKWNQCRHPTQEELNKFTKKQTDDFRIDELVLVKDKHSSVWYVRHFAEF